MEYDVCVREVSYYNVFVEANSKKEAAALAKAMVDHREVTAPYSITPVRRWYRPNGRTGRFGIS